MTVSENCTVYARLYDGTNTGESATAKVSNIDTTPPTIDTALSATNTSSSFTLKLTASDDLSGISNITWYYKGEDDTEYTYETDTYVEVWSEETGETDSTDYEHTFTGISSGNYEAYAVIQDVAGNITDTSDEDTPNGGGTIEITTEGIPTDISFTYSTTDWTNEDVTVTASTSSTGYTIQMSEDGETYTDTTTLTYSKNGTVYARLTDGTNYGTAVTDDIDWIDTTNPYRDGDYTDATVTTSTIKYPFTATDEASGVKKIQFYIGTSTSSYTLKKTVTCSTKETYSYTYTYTFSGLTAGKTYYLKFVVTDYAGNTYTDTTQLTTETLPSATSSISTSYSPTTWTNGSVTVTATTSTDYTIQYSTDLSTWTEGSTYETTENCSVYFRLTDGTNVTSTYATATVDKIDTTPPTIVTEQTATATSSTVTTTVTAQDTESGISQVQWAIYEKEYEETYETDTYQTMNGSEEGSTDEEELSHTFTGLTAGTTYYVYAIVYDVAGNQVYTTSDDYGDDVEITTPTIPGEYDEDGNQTIAFTYSTTDWTNESVYVYISTTTSYSIQYNVTDPTDEDSWIDYTGGVEFTENGSIWARLVDSAGQTGEYATGSVGNIDTTPPEVSLELTDYRRRLL